MEICGNVLPHETDEGFRFICLPLKGQEDPGDSDLEPRVTMTNLAAGSDSCGAEVTCGAPSLTYAGDQAFRTPRVLLLPVAGLGVPCTHWP